MNKSTLPNKTISAVDDSCCNQWILHFTDGTHVTIDADMKDVGAGARSVDRMPVLSLTTIADELASQ